MSHRAASLGLSLPLPTPPEHSRGHGGPGRGPLQALGDEGVDGPTRGREGGFQKRRKDGETGWALGEPPNPALGMEVLPEAERRGAGGVA